MCGAQGHSYHPHGPLIKGVQIQDTWEFGGMCWVLAFWECNTANTTKHYIWGCASTSGKDKAKKKNTKKKQGRETWYGIYGAASESSASQAEQKHLGVFLCLFFFFPFIFFFWGGGGFKDQMKWPEGPPHLALNPPYILLFWVCLNFCFLGRV